MYPPENWPRRGLPPNGVLLREEASIGSGWRNLTAAWHIRPEHSSATAMAVFVAENVTKLANSRPPSISTFPHFTGRSTRVRQ